jgi:hypothetical protein
MCWSQAGVENLLRLRAVAENDDWDAYHNFRKQQRHARLYGSPGPEQTALEMQALDHAPVTPPSSTSISGSNFRGVRHVGVLAPQIWIY